MRKQYFSSERSGAAVKFRCSLVLVLYFLVITFSTAAQERAAPGAPGTIPTWMPGNKEAVGTSTSTESRVWFTLQGGVLSEVLYPRVDRAAVRSLEFAVSDGKSVWLESKDMRHSIERMYDNALLYRQTSRDPAGRFEISKIYATDPAHDTLLIDVTFKASQEFALYILYIPALKNSGVGDTGYDQDGALIKSLMTAASCSSVDRCRN